MIGTVSPGGLRQGGRLDAAGSSKGSFELVRELIQRDYPFKDREEARRFFKQLHRFAQEPELRSAGLAGLHDVPGADRRIVKTLGRPATQPNNT